MHLQLNASQIQLKTKKPYQPGNAPCFKGYILIRINVVFLSLFCFLWISYSARDLKPWKTDHEHSINRAGL